MRRLITPTITGFMFGVVATTLGTTAWAANGTWNSAASGDWDTAGNWVGGTVADGAGFTANFTQPDLTATRQINLLNARTISNLTFSDSNVGTGAPSNWELTGAALTLAAPTPTITVNAMNAGGVAVINAPLDGTVGLTKAGAGLLALGGTNTITGGMNVNGGTLRFEDAAVVPVQAITIRNGATLNVAAGIGTATTGVLNVPAANTGNIVTRGGGSIAAIGGGAGSVLNVSSPLDGATVTAAGAWNAGGSLGSVNISGIAGGAVDYFRIHSNGGAYVANSLLNTAVNINDVVMFTRTGSGGNVIDIGSLSGNAGAVLSGGGGGAAGGTGTGSFATYSIGSLNANTTFAGTIDTQSAMPDTGTLLGGFNLTKVGTGVLTLSGTLNYQPTMNGTANRRGGITTISGGTLKLTGNAAILGGVTDGTNNFLSTIRLVSPAAPAAPAALDVSGTASPYSTAPLQQVIGVGNVIGNYGHDEGVLAPGDTLAGGATPTAVLVAAAGTMTFNNNLSFAGSGEIKFNVSPSTTSGNDLIRVVGTTSLTGTPTLNLGLLGGVGPGSYTIVQSDGGFGGTNASGWIVGWSGRGSIPALSTSGNNLILTVTPANFGNLNWSGATNSTWDSGAGGTLNWRNNGTNAADRFFDNDFVTFADTFGPGTPVANTSISLPGTVSPLVMTFNSATAVYSITGAGKISGGASIVKTGPTLLTLQTANDFTGSASITGTGGVDIGAFPTALGTGVLTLTNTKLTTTGGTLSNSGITLGAGTASEIAANGATALVVPALTGDGNLSITTDSAGRQVDLSSNPNYTGDLILGAPASANNLIVRLNGSSLASTKVTLNNASFRDRATSAQTQTLGALEGDANSSLWGYQGGSTSTERTWQIGTLNLSTTFAGVIQDSINTRVVNITKLGTGTLTLTGTNTYTGRTIVAEGTLSINNGYLADAADVLLSPSGILNLNFAGTDLIDSLFINGIAQKVGIYGGAGSGATFISPRFTGSGTLTVGSQPLQGDFDLSGLVDAADLTILRTNFGANFATSAMGDADGDGDTDGNDFLIWQRNLGRTTPPAVASSGAVPEPSALVLAAAGVAIFAGSTRRRS